MSIPFAAQATCLIAACVGGTYFLSTNTEQKPETTLGTDEIIEKKEVELSKTSVVSIPRTNGQFFARGRVNNGSVQFLIDTGASTIALTVEDARKAGIDVRKLKYVTPVNTANGQAMAAPVMLRDVRIGGVRVTNVRALVLKDGLHMSLLGMTFLGELQKVEVMPNQMVLRR